MASSQDLQDAIAALWGDARPRLIARVDALEQAAAGALEGPEFEQASTAAHTLAGTLGAFGRTEATAAARSVERALEAGDRTALIAAVRALRALV
jgi:HPt (histidine-containing phosphotransfer) domain-containing protein